MSLEPDPTSGRRVERVAGEIQKVLARALVHEVRDPRLHEITVTRVRPAPDLKHARVYYTTMDDSDGARDEIARAFEHATPFLRRRLGQDIGLRYTPGLRFYYDDELADARRIDELLRSSPPHDGEPEEGEEGEP